MKIENDKVVNHRGDVLAEKVYGQWNSKEQAVLDFIAAQEKPVAAKKELKKETPVSKKAAAAVEKKE